MIKIQLRAVIVDPVPVEVVVPIHLSDITTLATFEKVVQRAAKEMFRRLKEMI